MALFLNKCIYQVVIVEVWKNKNFYRAVKGLSGRFFKIREQAHKYKLFGEIERRKVDENQRYHYQLIEK